MVQVKQSTPAQNVQTLTHADFNKEVMESDDLWVINLSAGPRCGACEGMKKTIREIVSQNDEFCIQNEELCA